jgi:hypothetical protein
VAEGREKRLRRAAKDDKENDRRKIDYTWAGQEEYIS